jgi:biotin carboxyl carrier protein
MPRKLSSAILAATLVAASASAWAAPAPVTVRCSIGGVVVEALAAGTSVQEGVPIVIVQTATKPREVAARANRDGIVSELLVRVGDRIDVGDPVARIRPR